MNVVPTNRVIYSISLTLKTPFLFPKTSSIKFGLNIACLRDESTNKLLIPSDQICGVIREQLEDLSSVGSEMDSASIEKLFGKESENGEKPEQARVSFSDMKAPQPKNDKNDTVITRIRLDEETQAVKRGHLISIEQPCAPGKEITFDGEVLAYLSDNSEKSIFEKAIKAALQSIQGIGSYKSSGFGEVTNCDFSEKKAVIIVAGTKHKVSPNVNKYEVTFDRPILVNAEMLGQNAFRGADVIPGAVFKGALAKKKAYSDPNVGKDFNIALANTIFSHAIPKSFSHAIPKSELERNLYEFPLPLSIASFSNEAQFDVLQCSCFKEDFNDTCNKGVMLNDNAAFFQGDWKSEIVNKVQKQLLCSKSDKGIFEYPDYIINTHTSIQDNVAEDQKIFTTIAKSNKWGGKNEKRPWILNVTFPDDMQAGIIEDILKSGLDNIGKTNAQAVFAKIEADDCVPVSPIENTTNEYAIVLLTDALITKPNETRTAFEAYKQYWEEVLPNASLKNFFAQQKYAGGYQAKRYRLYGKTYHPFILTSSRSVFLLHGDIQEDLERLYRSGLPVPSDLNATWENCPFVPENGYGHFRADYLSEWGCEFINQEGVFYG